MLLLYVMGSMRTHPKFLGQLTQLIWKILWIYLFNQDFLSVKILLLPTKIKYLLADREFMNREWLEFLTKNKIDYAITLRKGMSLKIEGNIKTLAVGRSFD